MKKRIIGVILSGLLLTTPLDVSAQGATNECEGIPDDIWQYACLVEMETNVSACLLCSIAYEESRFIPTVTNNNCKGLMQVNVSINKDLMESNGMTDWTDPYQSLYNAATLLLSFQDDPEDDLTLALYLYGGWDTEEYLKTGKLNDYVSRILERSYEYETLSGRH